MNSKAINMATVKWDLVYKYHANYHNWGLPLCLLLSTTLSTLVHLLLSIPSNVPFYYSCLFLPTPVLLPAPASTELYHCDLVLSAFQFTFRSHLISASFIASTLCCSALLSLPSSPCHLQTSVCLSCLWRV